MMSIALGIAALTLVCCGIMALYVGGKLFIGSAPPSGGEAPANASAMRKLAAVWTAAGIALLLAVMLVLR